MKCKLYGVCLLLMCGIFPASAQKVSKLYEEPFRPQYHFSPPENWTNDPNGMVYYEGEYHLFYQYYPGGKHWGPMHWGHAVSTDLFHWKNLPVALYPDSLGYIFSGSAVVDEDNTAGFQKGKEKTLVAIYTYHNPENEEETQGIAYSTDRGRTWIKYADNPVISNPGLKDFRDPKVRWYAPLKRWIMSLACGDHIQFYSSSDLKNWKMESSFGSGIGAHGGVWECPDLFPLTYQGAEKWILIVNLNPGGPAGGSATQYFIGRFDGHQFIPDDATTRWLDYGADEYAGVTWSNTGDKIILIGWMNNWQYADKIPTDPWRGAMTLPRELKLAEVDGVLRMESIPVKSVEKIATELSFINNPEIPENGFVLPVPGEKLSSSEIDATIAMQSADGFTFSLENDDGEHVDFGYDREAGLLFVDRRRAGISDFSEVFAKRQVAPVSSKPDTFRIRLFYDRSAVELFVNGGARVFTDQVFPQKPYNKIKINFTGNSGQVKDLKVSALHSVWRD